MLKYVVGDGLVRYEGETFEQALERDRKMREHNARVDQEYAYAVAPMKALWPWCRKHAPHLLPEGER